MPWSDPSCIGARTVAYATESVGDGGLPRATVDLPGAGAYGAVITNKRDNPLHTVPSDITIVPNIQWDKASNWNISEVPGNLSGKSAQALGQHFRNLRTSNAHKMSVECIPMPLGLPSSFTALCEN